ncbi:MAG TPA: ABC transporter permease [Acidobacteriaceae bacterium]|nr:ABC transporter permease [Acidobacteriaceae bacterium]
MVSDLKLALRQLRKSPGFTLTAVLTLALGIGATTSIFTLVYDVMLRPLPLPQADRLVRMEEKAAEWSEMYPTLPVSANHFTFWEQHSRSFAAMAVMEEYDMPLGTSGRPLLADVLEATPGIFNVLAVQPWLGRGFDAAEGQPGHERVVVLTYDLWRNQFGGDRGIIGRTVKLNGYPYTVLGVMPAWFHMPPTESYGESGSTQKRSLGALIPMAFSKDELEEAMGDLNYFGLARLKPGVTVAQANAELDAEQHTISGSLPADEKATLSAVLTPLQEELVGTSRRPLGILLGAVAGLLLVGCINIANLLLARAAGQRQQMAVAAALGASRADMLRLAMRETVVLAAMGCGLGMLLAMAIVPAMQRYLPAALDFRGELHLDWAGMGCALALAALATMLAGAAPAWMVSRTAPQDVLHSESRLASESRGSKRMRRALVGVEVAVSVALVLMTGLVTASLVKLLRQDRGFDAARTMTATVELPSESYPNLQKRAEFYREVLPKLNALPGVEHAALTSVLPLGGNGWGDIAQLAGDSRPWTQLPGESWRWVSPEYFAAIRLPLVAGHSFSMSDWGRNEAIVTERTAKTLWPGRNPLGQQFRRSGATGEAPFTVVGVIADARVVTLAKPDPMMIYVPYWFRCDAQAHLVLRTSQDPAAMADTIRKTIWSVDAGVPVPEVRTLSGVVADSVANRRFEMDLLLLFAVSALLLAGLGVYGVVTYSVVQRQREIGLRLALGAQRVNIYGLILREGLLPVAAGALAGTAIALASARLAGSLLFDVSPYDPGIVTGAVCVLLAVGTAACLLPARRAAGVEPMEALRAE